MQSALRLATNAILITVALLVATPATAAEFQRYPQPNNRPDHIAVSGRIQTNDEQKFVELTADLKDAPSYSIPPEAVSGRVCASAPSTPSQRATAESRLSHDGPELATTPAARGVMTN